MEYDIYRRFYYSCHILVVEAYIYIEGGFIHILHVWAIVGYIYIYIYYREIYVYLCKVIRCRVDRFTSLLNRL